MDIKDVIILGAGASKSERVPVQDELFEEFYRRYRKMVKDNAWGLEIEEAFNDFFRDCWGIDYQDEDVNFPTFEECFGILDLARLRGESLKGYNKEMINKVRGALMFRIVDTLNYKTSHIKMVRNCHKDLIDRLKKDEKLKQTAFISLNYDLIIDNVLRDHPNFQPDYGIEFVDSGRHNEDEQILLLKIHGSLDWLYCPTCNQLKLTPAEDIGKTAYYPIYCQMCGTPMEPVIVLPTFYKEMSNPFIRGVFLKADKILREADRIFICGYSFPDADMHIKYLLKRGEMFRGETPEIYVINNHRDKTSKQKEDEERRITRFFKNKDNVHYTNLSFEEFSKKGL